MILMIALVSFLAVFQAGLFYQHFKRGQFPWAFMNAVGIAINIFTIVSLCHK
jgi:hypothetical protein